MAVYDFTPSYALADIEIGGFFRSEDGKVYRLLARDPWKAQVERYYWFSYLLDRLKQRVRIKLQSVERTKVKKEKLDVNVTNGPKRT